MTHLAVQISDAQKADLLIQLLSALDFVEAVTLIPEPNGLPESYPSAYHSPQHAQMLQEEVAFDALLPELLSRYPNEFVAMAHQQVLDHDQDEITLATRVYTRYPDTVILIRPVLEESEPPLVFRSPRLVR